MNNLLLIEDDHDYAQSFQAYMQQQQFAVNHVASLDYQIIDEAIKKKPKVIILDFFFGCDNSIEMYLHLKKYQIPIIYLTSNTNSNDELLLLKAGVSDYIDKLKPFAVILQKIKKHMEIPKLNYDFFGNTLDVETKTINGNFKLTDNEYKILRILIQNLGIYVTSETLMLELWNDNVFIEKNTLFVAIKRLREKLRKYELNVVIDSQKNQGYQLNELS